jgi:hypothetical protein
MSDTPAELFSTELVTWCSCLSPLLSHDPTSAVLRSSFYALRALFDFKHIDMYLHFSFCVNAFHKLDIFSTHSLLSSWNVGLYGPIISDVAYKLFIVWHNVSIECSSAHYRFGACGVWQYDTSLWKSGHRKQVFRPYQLLVQDAMARPCLVARVVCSQRQTAVFKFLY